MADLLAMLGSAGSMNDPSSSNNTNNNTAAEPLVILKAGQMTTAKLDNGKYQITPELERGQIEIVINAENQQGIKFIWRSRQTKTVGEEMMIFEEDKARFQKVQEDQRIYILTFENQAMSDDRRFFFWLQDIDDSQDLELTRKVAKFVESPKTAGGREGDESNVNNGGSEGTVAQPDLSSILNNLQQDTATATSNTSTSTNNAVSGNATASATAEGTRSSTTTTAATATGGQLTLADLQGAMAGLATSSPPATTPTPSAARTAPLSEIASFDNVLESGILTNEEFKAKLIALLPEGQQTEEHLMENLSSPQVRASLSSLSGALVTSPESFQSVIMNFQLRPEDAGVNSMINPIQGFLDCLVAQVERERTSGENGGEGKETDAQEEGKEGTN